MKSTTASSIYHGITFSRTIVFTSNSNLMKRLLFLVLLAVSFFSCASYSNNTVSSANSNTNSTGSKMKIEIGNSTFRATLYDNQAATAFKSLLPLTLNMIELNGNEKYVDLSRSLPTTESNPGTIQNGDLMLYGSSTLVLFYKTFSTSYSYTKLGRIDDVTGLVAALDTGNINVWLELE
jgi:hypothetical protein